MGPGVDKPTYLHLRDKGHSFEDNNSVTLSKKNICALKGTYVDIPCTYTVNGYSVQSKEWYRTQTSGGWGRDLRTDPEYKTRVKYDDWNCELRIKSLRLSDSGVYNIRFKTWNSDWISGPSGVKLSVSDLLVKVTTEVEWFVKLTCSITCSPYPRLQYDWYKNGYFERSSSDSILLHKDTSWDDGSYFCSVRNQKNIRSPEVCIGQKCWSITYSHENICALRGSSVDLSCSYTYPAWHTVTTTLWFNTEQYWVEPTDLSLDEDYEGRVEFRGDKKSDCTLRIRDLRESDARNYKFRFLTNQEGGKYSAKTGVSLSITDLKVEIKDNSWRRTLTCKTSCSLSNNPTFIWYKNGQPYRTYGNTQTIYLSNTADGSYSCAVKEFEGLRSPAVYPPKNTRASINSSGEIVEGSPVTLICSSDANPPVHTYTWYKKNGAEPSPMGSGQNFSITNISSEDSGQYYCKAKNILGPENSTLITIDVLCE
ncbi:B-cell receptor CD22-like [Chanos chanos]|uniref:B-cell receptor CD22 n=1 Tax=Chanos chanos TaxID=29144 RepID=A0A6J2W0A2_CHACN|nr:B-cell receptor CD22-like [Chanos chanos]